MGLKKLYNDLKTAIEGTKYSNGDSIFKSVRVWNNQLEHILGDSNKEVSIQYPMCFIEVVVDSVEQLGNSNQLWNCTLNAHVLHEFYNNIYDSEFDSNTDVEVFDINDRLWLWLQNTKVPECNNIVGLSQEQDYNHDNIYHYIQSFKFNYVYSYSVELESKLVETLKIETENL